MGKIKAAKIAPPHARCGRIMLTQLAGSGHNDRGLLIQTSGR
jgi:hypothetical protein